MSHITEYALMAVSVGGALVALLYAWKKFSNPDSYRDEKTTTEETGIGKILANKWYVDELYETIIVKPMQSFAGFLNNTVERKGIDGFVSGIGKAVNYGSRQIRFLQSGQVGTYILLMVVGILIMFIIQFLSK